MKRNQRKFTSVGLLAGAMAALHLLVLSSCQPAKEAENLVKEAEGLVDGMECYIYGLPLVLMDVTKSVLTGSHKTSDLKAPLNQFARIRTYVTPEVKDVVRISVSSLWSHGFVDLDQDAWVISQPDTKGRYIVVQGLNMWTEDFMSVGARNTGTEAGNFLIVGPNWKGATPPDIKQTFRCTTRYAWVLVQMACNNPAEYPVIHALQDQLKMTPLTKWGQPYTPPEDVPIDPAADLTATPFDQVRLMPGWMFFQRLASVLKENPPNPADTKMVAKLKTLGIEPGKDFDPSKASPGLIAGMNKAATLAFNKLGTAQNDMKGVNGWLTATDVGTYGTDYNTRAFIAYMGLGALSAEDCIYPTTFVDGDGNFLLGDKKYVIHFEKDKLPPSHSGVWSISQYRENFYVHNPLERYGILSSMPLKYNADGSLDIYLQKDSPGPDKEANWLPNPPSLPFNLTMRVYQPKKEMMDGHTKDNLIVEPSSYVIPPVRKVE